MCFSLVESSAVLFHTAAGHYSIINWDECQSLHLSYYMDKCLNKRASLNVSGLRVIGRFCPRIWVANKVVNYQVYPYS